MQSEREKKMLSVTALAENFGKVLSPELLRMWLKLLEPYPAAQVKRAAMRVILEYEYKTLPPFATLKKALEASAPSLTCASPEIQAAAEWGKLLDDVSARGSWHGAPENMNPVTAYILRGLGGWDAACQWKTEKLEFIEKQFISRWKEAAENADLLQIPVLANAALPEGMSSAKVTLDPCLAALESVLARERA